MCKQNRRELGNLDPKAGLNILGLKPYSHEDGKPMIERFSRRSPLGDCDTSDDIYQYDSLNGLSWVLRSQGKLLEANAVLEEARDLMMRIVYPEGLQEIVWLRQAGKKFRWIDWTPELMKELTDVGCLSHKQNTVDFAQGRGQKRNL